MPDYSGSGFLILATGSFFGEIGSDGEGELFINSHGKTKGIVLDGAEKISSSVDGTKVDREIRNSATGQVLGVRRTELSGGILKQSFFSASVDEQDSRIQFLQQLSGSNK